MQTFNINPTKTFVASPTRQTRKATVKRNTVATATYLSGKTADGTEEVTVEE